MKTENDCRERNRKVKRESEIESCSLDGAIGEREVYENEMSAEDETCS